VTPDSLGADTVTGQAITAALLARATGAKLSDAERYAPHLDAACAHFKITGPARVAAFLAQLGHESGSLRHVRELASGEAYEGRKGLGNTEPGDGPRFKGRGLIQVTGRYNYRRVTARLRALGAPDFVANPQALEDPKWACWSATDWWDEHGCNVFADKGEFVRLGRLINRGNAYSQMPANGEADRLRRWAVAKAAFGSTSDIPVVAAPTPPKEAPMPLPAILGALLPTLIESIPKLGKLFGSGSDVAERNVKAATMAMEIAQEALGATNAQDTVERIQADPEAKQTATRAIEARWFELAESGGGGIDGARKAALAYSMPDGPRFWFNPAFWISAVLLLMPFMLLVDVFYVHPESYAGEIRTQIVTAILMVVSMVGAYWIGTSFSSARKTEIASRD